MSALSPWMPVSFQGDSMLPTLVAGDRLLVKRTQSDAEHKRGDIVFFRDPRGLSDTLIIKRIIGLPGESVRASRLVYINGELLKEPYLQDDIEEFSQSARGVNQIRDASYFVMGDNRRASTDSRDFGVINASEILGTAILRYLPIIRFTKLNRHH